MGEKELLEFKKLAELFKNSGHSNEIVIKQQFLNQLKKSLGNDCVIKDFTESYGDGHNFRKLNIVHIKRNDIETILFFHMSISHSRKNRGFYGFSKEYTENILNYIRTNTDKKIYFYLNLMLDISNDEIINFILPIYLIKNNESKISKGEDGQYKLTIENENGSYYLKLNKGEEEPLSNFIKDIREVFNKELIEKYNEEQEKFFEKQKAQNEILKKYMKT